MREKKHTKVGSIGSITAILLFAAIVIIDTELYPYRIQPDLSNLESCITEFDNRGRKTPASPALKIYDSLTFGTQTIVLIEIGENSELGTVTLQKNIFGHYKINKLSHGSGSFLYGVIEQGGSTYMLLGGKNTAGEIAGADFIQGGTIYHLDIPQKPCFLVYTEVDDRGQETYWDVNTLTLYDAQSSDITETYDLSGSGIYNTVS